MELWSQRIAAYHKVVDICIIIQVAYLTIRASADRNEVESRMRGKSRCTDRDKQGGRVGGK